MKQLKLFKKLGLVATNLNVNSLSCIINYRLLQKKFFESLISSHIGFFPKYVITKLTIFALKKSFIKSIKPPVEMIRL